MAIVDVEIINTDAYILLSINLKQLEMFFNGGKVKKKTEGTSLFNMHVLVFIR